MLTEENVRRGMTREEARRSALIRVGAGALHAALVEPMRALREE
jgi:hypothetical protein